MPTKPMNDLIKEHGAIMLMLNILKSVTVKLETGEAVSPDDLRQMVDFIREFADKCHHGKEEFHLFPALLTKPDNARLVSRLIGEHKLGRDYVRGMDESLAGYQPGNPDAFHFARCAQGYIALLAHHIRTENDVLFPIADHLLTETQLSELVAKFEQVENEVIGEGRHAALHELLKTWQKKYITSA